MPTSRDRKTPTDARVVGLLWLAAASSVLSHCSESRSGNEGAVGGASAASGGGAPASGGSTPAAGGGNAARGVDASGRVSDGGSGTGDIAGPRAIRPDAGTAANDVGVDAGRRRVPRIAYDWNGVVGTGQSLSVGEPGAANGTPAGTARLTTQPFGNLKLSTGALPWPVDANDPTLTLVPLVEPIGRIAPTYPSAWPENIAFNGETPHSAMANQLTTLVRAATGADFVGVHGDVGENGQCLSLLAKGATPVGVNGRAYEATLIETRAITRLAQAAGQTYGVAAITVTHGECDAGNTRYEDQLFALYTNYATDLPAITGQAEPPLMIVSQQNSTNDASASALAAWTIGVKHPEQIVCSGPKYQYPYTTDALHLVVDGYEQLGEKYAQVYYERVLLGNDWQPLQPIAVERDPLTPRVITVRFHVPVPPLAWEESFQLPHQTSSTEWSAGRGFEVRAGQLPVPIASVEIDADTVRITTSADLPPTGVTVAYALTGDPDPMTTPFPGVTRWGQLRDSDPFIGATTQKPQPNFALAFELAVP